MNAHANSNVPQVPLASSLQTNYDAIRSIYANCKDVMFRPFTIGETTDAVLFYIDGMVNQEILDLHILTPLLRVSQADWEAAGHRLASVITISRIAEAGTLADIVERISGGFVGLLLDGVSHGFCLGIPYWEKRGIEEPAAESIVRGPREGFTETMSVNTAMLRRKIKSPSLKMVSLEVGSLTHTEVVIAYMEGIASEQLIADVRQRIETIRIDGILESGYIEGLIEDSPFSPFPQLQTTERPDVVSASLLEGRVAVLVDGTPLVLLGPATLFSMLQSPEDYYQRWMISTLIRWLRYFFLIITMLLPSLYVAILTYHQEMVPTKLLLSIAKSREDIPFPALIEALLMEISFEALREAGVRLPKQVGAAVSIVGALVIGQAATSAGLVSDPMVMVVAITGIASFMLPQYPTGIAFRMLRFPIMFLSGMLGLVGLMLGLIVVVIHLCSLRSLGVPYLQPIAPFRKGDWKDVLARAPIWALRTRPGWAPGAGEPLNRKRLSNRPKPDPQKD